ncbi:MAG: sodium/substrate symporter small subunit, partial [Myxococcota bacterium]
MGREDFVSDNGNAQAYWQANLRILAVLLSIWFIVSYGCEKDPEAIRDDEPDAEEHR